MPTSGEAEIKSTCWQEETTLKNLPTKKIDIRILKLIILEMKAFTS
jgi:hypothetical protein